MAYGISIYNSANNIIISQDYSNYHVVSTGTVANGGSYPSIGSNDVIYFRLNTNGAYLNTERTGSPPVLSVSISAGLLEYVIVRRTPSPSSSTYGLRIYQSDGVTIAFDSGATCAKIISSYTKVASSYVYASWTATLNQPFAVPTGRKRYISGQQFIEPANFFVSGPFYAWYIAWGYERLTWTSDMQQTIATMSGYDGGYDMQSTKIYLTIDI